MFVAHKLKPVQSVEDRKEILSKSFFNRLKNPILVWLYKIPLNVIFEFGINATAVAKKEAVDGSPGTIVLNLL